MALPSCLEAGGHFSLAFVRVLRLQPVRDVQQRAEQGGAVVAGQLDQPGLLDKATKFDEQACACTSFLRPVAGVVASLGEVGPILLHGQAPELRRCGLQLPEQGRRLLSSPACPLLEKRLARVRSTS